VSFAWIRTDTNFRQLPLNYNNGFIFYPQADTPPGKKTDINVLCTFPFDGWTDIRNQQGCGTNTAYPTQSRPCNDQGINTGLLWINHFNAAPDKYKAQCGWNVREGQANTADRFYQSIDGRSRITSSEWYGNNELRLATWARGIGAQLPIQSFFYIAGSAAGRLSAQDDQRRYDEAYGEVIPVVQLTLAPDRTGKASFVYRESDQVVEGSNYATINFEDVDLQEEQQAVVTEHGTFRWISDYSGWMAVRGSTSTPPAVVGKHLYVPELGVQDYAVQFTPSKPVSRISYSVGYPNGGLGNTAAYVHLSDGKKQQVATENLKFDYVAPAGLSIKSIDIFVLRNGTALDNIKLYE